MLSAGVYPTGSAAVDPQKSSTVITIEGGNEPHGVFSFAFTSLHRTTPEGAALVQLTVDRKFGAIGKVFCFFPFYHQCQFYDIFNFSVHNTCTWTLVLKLNFIINKQRKIHKINN